MRRWWVGRGAGRYGLSVIQSERKTHLVMKEWCATTNPTSGVGCAEWFRAKVVILCVVPTSNRVVVLTLEENVKRSLATRSKV